MSAAFEQLRAGFLQATSYRAAFVLGILARLSALVWVYFVAQLVGNGTSAGMPQGYLAFALVGMATQQYLHYVLSAFPEKLRDDQLSGLLPALLVSPAPAVLALFGPLLWGLVERAVVLALALVVASFGFGVDLGAANWAAAAAVLVLMTLAVGAWGVLSACFTLVMKRGDPIVWLSETLGFVLSGAIVPLSVLPEWMRAASKLYPHAHAVNAARLALLGSPSAKALIEPIGVLALFAILLVPSSLWLLAAAIRRVRAAGSAGFY